MPSQGNSLNILNDKKAPLHPNARGLLESGKLVIALKKPAVSAFFEESLSANHTGAAQPAAFVVSHTLETSCINAPFAASA